MSLNNLGDSGTPTSGALDSMRNLKFTVATLAMGALTSCGGGGGDTTPSPVVDTTPGIYDIIDIPNATPNTTYTTNAITVSNINTQTTATTTIGTIVLNGIDTGVSSVSVNSGDTVAVTGTTPTANSATINGTITIGGISDVFSITTAPLINTAPTAQDVIFDALSSSPITGDLNPSIADPESADNLLNINVSTQPTNGTLTWVGNQFTYTANAGFSGTDSFTYFAIDPGTLQSAIRTVTINNIVGVNTLPTLTIATSTLQGFPVDTTDPYNQGAQYTILGTRDLIIDPTGSVDTDGTITNLKITSDIAGVIYNGAMSTLQIPRQAGGLENLTIQITDNSGGITTINKRIARY